MWFFCLQITVSDDIVWQVLKSDEGRQLRERHQSNVRYLRSRLMEAGLPVVHCPSHIIPIHVSRALTRAFPLRPQLKQAGVQRHFKCKASCFIGQVTPEAWCQLICKGNVDVGY